MELPDNSRSSIAGAGKIGDRISTQNPSAPSALSAVKLYLQEVGSTSMEEEKPRMTRMARIRWEKYALAG